MRAAAALFVAVYVCDASAFSFLSIGDWGGASLKDYHQTNELNVAKAMGKEASSVNAQFVINVGDNFYYCGVKSTTDPLWETDFENVYTADSLKSIKWYGVLGNHDYGFSPEAQLQYKSPHNDRWQIPARYYTKRIALSSTQYATFVFIDSNPCIQAYRSTDSSGWDPCSSQYKDDPCCGKGGWHDNIVAQDCSKQAQWLKQTLATVPKGDWLIAVGHHPFDELDVEDLTTELQAAGVHLYLNGHTHSLTYYSVDGKGAYVTTGAGCMVDPAENSKPENTTSLLGHTFQSMWNKKNAGFTVHTFSDDFSSLLTKFVDVDGKTIYSFTVNKGSGPTPPGPNPPTPPSPPSPKPAPTPPPSPGMRYHCNDQQKCVQAQQGHSTMQKCEDTCGGTTTASCRNYGCHTRYDRDHQCQCNDACMDHGDCCPDFKTLCHGSNMTTTRNA